MTDPVTAAYVVAASVAASAGASAYSSHQSGKRPERAAREQMEQAERLSREEDQARNKVNRKEADISGILENNKIEGLGNTTLTGGMGALVCDPIAGLVEVPCVKRNAAGAVIAMTSADIALAGIRSAVPPDEVIMAMKEVGDKMDVSLRETGMGGVAATPFGQMINEKMSG